MRLHRSRLALAAAVLLAAPLAAQEAAELTAEQVVARSLEARGGLEAIQAVDSARITGKMMMQGMEVPVVMEWKRPSRARMELTVQGQTGVQAYDGTTAWMHMPFMGKAEPERMPEEAVDDMEEMADFDGSLVDYAAKGHTVELLGREEVDGTDAYKLKLTKKGGDESTIWIDADHFLEIKQEAKRNVGDQTVETETVIGNYKQVGDLVLPHSMEMRAKGAPAGAPGQTIVIDAYDLGVELDDARFAFPATTDGDE